MDQAIWKKVKKFLLPYEGMASQIYLLAIPQHEIGPILQIVEQEVTGAVISKVSAEPLQAQMPLADVLHNNDFSDRFFAEPWKISAKILKTADIVFDFWPDKQNKAFDLEAWFWADQLFSGDDSHDSAQFSKLLAMLKTITGHGKYRCILTPLEASDPLDDLQKGQAVEIDLHNLSGR